MSRKARTTSLPPPFLKRVWLPGDAVKMESDWDSYPLSLPIIHSGGFDITFEKPVTIIVGENGSGKSTLLEAIATMFLDDRFFALGGNRHSVSFDIA